MAPIKKVILIGLFLLIPRFLSAQPLPCVPNVNSWTTTTTVATLKICNSDGSAWITFEASSSSIPTGSILLIDTGTCPTGFSEVSGLSTKTLIGTLAANKDVGTTGGNDNIIPTGTNSVPTFTGNAITFTEVINHTHAVTSVGSSATGSTTNLTGASDTSSTTATATNPSGGVASFQKTPTGSVSAPIFTGNSFDNRSAFVKIIFCKKT